METEPQIYRQSGHYHQINQTIVGTASKGMQILTQSLPPKLDRTNDASDNITTVATQLVLPFEKSYVVDPDRNFL